MPLTGWEFVVQLSKLCDLKFAQRATGGHEPVAVTVPIASSERERPLYVGPGQIVAENPAPLAEQLCEELIEVGIRRDDVGRSHTVEGRRRLISSAIELPHEEA